MDIRVVQARLKKLDECYRSLERFHTISPEAYLNDADTQAIVERKLQVAIQTCIDIANYLIAQLDLKIPDHERDIFWALQKASVISEEMAQQLQGMVNFRNILVHEYLEIDSQLVHAQLTQHLQDFNQFAQAIIKFIKTQ